MTGARVNEFFYKESNSKIFCGGGGGRGEGVAGEGR